MDKRDIVLSMFFSKGIKQNMHEKQIDYCIKLYNLENGLDKINEIDFDRILKQLIADGFINIDEDKNGKIYVSTEKLEDVFMMGGFIKKREMIKREDDKLSGIVERQLSQTESLVFLTRWLALGTVGLLVFEIIKFYLEHHCA